MDELLRKEIQRIVNKRRMTEMPSPDEINRRHESIDRAVRKAFEKHVLGPNGQTWADLELEDEEETQLA